MTIIEKYIDRPINRFFMKYRHKYDRERTKLELNNYWAAASRNVAPVTISEHKSGKYITINNETLACCIIVGVPTETENGYPEEMDDTMITKLIELGSKGCQISYSLKLRNIETSQARKDIQDSIYITEVNASEKIDDVKKKKNITMQDMDTKVAQDHNESNYRAVTKNKHKIFDSAFIITLRAKSVEDLGDSKSDIKLILESSSVKYEIPDNYHLKTYFAAQPFNTNAKFAEVRILSPYAAMITSSRNPNSKTDNEGLWFGTDKTTGKEILFDPHKMIAPHAIGVGPTGSGKTASVFGYMMRLLALDFRIIYITPKDDENTSHRALVDYYGPDVATLIDLGPEGQNINPLQIIYDRDQLNDNIEKYKYAFNIHKEIVIRFLDTWFKETGSPNMTGLMDSALNKVYSKAGIHRDIPSTWHNAKWPLMSDFIAELDYMKRSGHLSGDEYKTVGAILAKTISLDTDGMLGWMNAPTTVDFTKDLLAFDMSDVPQIIKDPLNILITAICGQRFRANTKKTIIVVDEARVFLTNEELTEFLLQTITMGRSKQVSLWVLTQQPSDLIKANVSEEFTTNSSLKFVFGTNILPENIELVENYFKLNESSSDNLLSSIVGDMVLIIGDQQIPLHVQLTELELVIINGKLNTSTQTTDGVLEPEFNQDLKDYILDHGFCMDNWTQSFGLKNWKMERVQNAFGGTGLATAWIREEIVNSNGLVINQSIDHYSSVMQIGAYLILKGITDVDVDDYSGPDIAFTISDEDNVKHSYAIEYEISGTHSQKELQEKRTRLLKKYDNIYFVCNARYKKKLVSWIGPDNVFARGSQLKNLLDGIVG